MKNVESVKLSPDATIRDALEIIDRGAMKIAVVVDEEGYLLGTITDGDIRRAILSGSNLDDTIEYIYFKSPTVIRPDTSRDAIINLCAINKIYQIPIVDETGRVIGIEILDRLLMPRQYPNKVILMVGGLGTRLRPLTENTPKPMLHVGGKPILHTIVERFASYGFTDIVMCVNYKSRMIKEYFGDGHRFGVHIEYVEEKERMGTAGALSLLPERPKDSFFVMNGDLLTSVNFEHMLEFHQANRATATMCVREYDFQVPFGVVNIEGAQIRSIVEKPVQRFFVNAGIYLLEPSCLDLVPKGQFYDMPTLFETLIEKDEKVVSFPLREYWLDIGRIEEYERANQEYDEVFDESEEK
ncbi:nucleotidyltransferase family protein [Hydrogenimonas urashimensis]|uniref:nucleotidyltransferase family protein n=1 Tax=Hydrogenimonas urashimensis TaxID=2740515 RepID=UPI0019164BA2|nr:nucleotidyltransferase family protein [Hydrogenimonas urashimensis]